MADCRYFPECQRCNEVGDSWIPCSGGSDGIQCDAYEPMPDVGALLALAEEMVEMFRIGAFTGEGIDRSWCRELYDKYARRIREACGVIA